MNTKILYCVSIISLVISFASISFSFYNWETIEKNHPKQTDERKKKLLESSKMLKDSERRLREPLKRYKADFLGFTNELDQSSIVEISKLQAGSRQLDRQVEYAKKLMSATNMEEQMKIYMSTPESVRGSSSSFYRRRFR